MSSEATGPVFPGARAPSSVGPRLEFDIARQTYTYVDENGVTRALTREQVAQMEQSIRPEVVLADARAAAKSARNFFLPTPNTTTNGQWSHIVNTTTPPSWVDEVFGTPRASVTKGSTNMLELLVKLYTTSIHTRQTSPMPHIVGPPGCGKSYTFQQLADLAGVNLHIVNVSRINPLGLEGLEMPVERNTRLKLLVSELWTKAKDGDIYLFDEFLRGFPEVYNGLLDIFTAREVAGHKLPNVFIAGASNSVATYDGALEDRLLHIPVADPRSNSKEYDRIARMIIEEIGLSPEVRPTPEMSRLMSDEVLPTYELLDKFDRSNARPNASSTIKGTSPRKLIGQARLRHLTSTHLARLISENNKLSEHNGSFEHVILVDKSVYQPVDYEDWARAHHNSAELSAIQRQNLELNLQLIEMEAAKKVNEQEVGDDNLAQYPLVG